jgi:alanyl-tRNA synthetase
MSMTEFLWQVHPPVLRHRTYVQKRNVRRGRVRVQVAACAFEPDNPEGGDRGQIVASNEASANVVRVIRDRHLPWIEIDSDSEVWSEGVAVEQILDTERRSFNAAHHSLGHAVTAAVKRITERPYVGKGTIHDWGSELLIFGGGELESSEVVETALKLVNDEITASRSVVAAHAPRLKMLLACGREFEGVIPAQISICRIVTFENSLLAPIPCSGVHVESLAQIGVPRLRSVRRLDRDLLLEFEILSQVGAIVRP